MRISRLFLLIVGIACCNADRSDDVQLVLTAVRNGDARVLSEKFAPVVSFEIEAVTFASGNKVDAMAISLSRVSSYSGFSQKRGDLYKELFTKTAAQTNYPSAVTFQKAYKDGEVVEIGNDPHHPALMAIHQGGVLAYWIFFECATHSCVVTKFLISPRK